MSRAPRKLTAPLSAPSTPLRDGASAQSNPESHGVWEYVPATGLYRNRATGAVAEEPDTDIPAAGTISVSAEEEGVTVPEDQFRLGVRLAISGRSGLIRRCPVCRRRRLLLIPRDGATFLSCAGNFATAAAGEAVEGACDFERELS